jgi:hypothetical protein
MDDLEINIYSETVGLAWNLVLNGIRRTNIHRGNTDVEQLLEFEQSL